MLGMICSLRLRGETSNMLDGRQSDVPWNPLQSDASSPWDGIRLVALREYSSIFDFSHGDED